jgi:hypothetical protein
MNGTTLRIATAVACVAALAAPGSALAKKHHRVAHKTATVPVPTIIVPHDYDAGGNGDTIPVVPAGVRVNLFDPVELANTLGNQALGDLGLPPVQLPPVTLPPLP